MSQEREEERAEEIWTPRPSSVARSAVAYARPSVPKPCWPTRRDRRETDEREQDEQAARDQSVLEPEPPAEPFEQRVALADPTRAYVRAKTPSWITWLRSA